MKLVTGWLTMKRIYFVRMNTYSGKVQSGAWLKQGRVGMADIVVMPRVDIFTVNMSDGKTKPQETVRGNAFLVKWLEVKAPKGFQSPDQKRFQSEVQEAGMSYYIIRSLEDLEAAFK